MTNKQSLLTIYSIITILVVLANAERTCTDCYALKDQKVQLACDLTKCDTFLWPKDSPLPINLQCKPSSQSNCFVLSGLDSTGHFHKFLSLNHLPPKPSSSQPIPNSSKKDIVFAFNQTSQKLIITATFGGNTYLGQLVGHPGVYFHHVQEAFHNQEFKLLTEGGQILKLKVGFYIMELKNTIFLALNDLKNTIAQMEVKMNQQSASNAQQPGVPKTATERLRKLQITNEQLRNQVARMTKKYNDSVSTTTASKTQLDGVNKQTKENNGRLLNIQKIVGQLKTRIAACQRKHTDALKVSEQIQRNNSNIDGKVLAVQQRVSNSDLVMSQLRQMLATSDRKLADVTKNHDHQWQIAQKLYNLILKIYNKNTKLIEIAQLQQMFKSYAPIPPDTEPQKQQSNSSETHKAQQVQNQKFALNEFPISLLSNNSKVVTSNEEVLTIESFFAPKKIAKVQLLYRASENEFLSSMFHKLCDKIPDTIVVIETEFNKKIGGFTPLLWDGTKNGEYQADQSGQSFIFSLTNRDKLTLSEKEKAIYNHFNYGPIFGGGADISICDESNEKPLSYVEMSKSYVNVKYKERERGSWQSFCGNPNNSWHFKVKEWEVWRVEFEQEGKK